MGRSRESRAAPRSSRARHGDFVLGARCWTGPHEPRRIDRARNFQTRGVPGTVAHQGNEYWATQTHVLLLEGQGWMVYASGKQEEAVAVLNSAASEEDGVEILPVTPGPIVPAREQLADMFLNLNRPSEALPEFEASLASSSGRRAALVGAARCAKCSATKTKRSNFAPRSVNKHHIGTGGGLAFDLVFSFS